MNAMPNTPLKLYQLKIKSGLIYQDPEQKRAVETLDKLFFSLIKEYEDSQTWLHHLASLWRPKDHDTPKGLYVYGGVGRGKSMLMDLFYDCLPGHIKKRRVHFHAFMIEVHDYFHARRSETDFNLDVDGLIPPLASLIAARAHVICFDEFHVTDIADAMILGRLFTALFDHGVVLIATSNWAPDRLYEGGLQRDRFLPFIEQLKKRTQVLPLESETDYRRMFLSEEGTYFHPLNADTNHQINSVFIKLTQGLPAHRRILKVKGRNIVVNHCVEGVARFSFAQLCENPYGAEDYLEIAKSFHTVFLENIPKLNYDRRNEAKRLMTLIDALYEAGTNLVVSADAPADDLYIGHDHAEEFERTVSRLMEMQRL